MILYKFDIQIHVMKKLGFVLLLLMMSVTFSGCLLELFELEGMEAGGLAVGEEGMALTAEDGTLAARYGTELRSGRFAIANENAAYSLYEDVTLRRAAGENPKLYVKGKAEPIGEVLTKQKEIRLRDGSLYKAEHNIFSVVGDQVRMYESQSLGSRVVATVRHGRMVVNLGDYGNGWYKVEIMEHNVGKTGFIRAGLLAAIIMVDSSMTPGYSYWDLKAGTIPFPDDSRMISDLMLKGIPGPQYIGNAQQQGWDFESRDEIKSFTQAKDPFLNGDGSYYQSKELDLQNDRTGRHCKAQVMIRYNVSGHGWKCTAIVDEGFNEIQKARPVYETRQRPDYPPMPEDNTASSNYYRNSAPPRGMPTTYNNSNGSQNTYRRGTGSVRVALMNDGLLTISIDGIPMQRHGTSITVTQLPVGWHRLAIFAYHENANRPESPLYNNSLQVFENRETKVVFNYLNGFADIR